MWMHLAEIVRQQIVKRSIRVFTGIGRQLRQGDLTGDGLLNKYELEKSLVDFHISIPQEVSCLSYASACPIDEAGGAMFWGCLSICACVPGRRNSLTRLPSTSSFFSLNTVLLWTKLWHKRFDI